MALVWKCSKTCSSDGRCALLVSAAIKTRDHSRLLCTLSPRYVDGYIVPCPTYNIWNVRVDGMWLGWYIFCIFFIKNILRHIRATCASIELGHSNASFWVCTVFRSSAERLRWWSMGVEHVEATTSQHHRTAQSQISPPPHWNMYLKWICSLSAVCQRLLPFRNVYINMCVHMHTGQTQQSMIDVWAKRLECLCVGVRLGVRVVSTTSCEGIYWLSYRSIFALSPFGIFVAVQLVGKCMNSSNMGSCKVWYCRINK